MTEKTLELYRETIRESLEGEEPVNAPNSSSRHASIILEELIRSAKRQLVVFCGGLGDSVWTPAVLNKLERLITVRKVPVEIIVADQIELNRIPLAVRPHIHVFNKALDARKAAVCRQIPHFTMIDDRSARIELDQQKKRAVFLANHSDVAE